MLRTIKLVIYYFLYQLLFTSLITLPSIWVQLMNNGGDVNSFTGTETSINTAGITMVLSGIAMIWHLIHFKYVKFSLKSFGEVSGKTIGLSIPLIVAGMIFINLCSEFIGLPDMMQDTFIDKRMWANGPNITGKAQCHHPGRTIDFGRTHQH